MLVQPHHLSRRAAKTTCIGAGGVSATLVDIRDMDRARDVGFGLPRSAVASVVATPGAGLGPSSTPTTASRPAAALSRGFVQFCFVHHVSRKLLRHARQHQLSINQSINQSIGIYPNMARIAIAISKSNVQYSKQITLRIQLLYPLVLRLFSISLISISLRCLVANLVANPKSRTFGVHNRDPDKLQLSCCRGAGVLRRRS